MTNKVISLSDDDARTIAAVLMTNSEMQDKRVHDAMKTYWDPNVANPMSDEQMTVLENDSDNLKRLASLFM